MLLSHILLVIIAYFIAAVVLTVVLLLGRLNILVPEPSPGACEIQRGFVDVSEQNP